HIEVGYEHDAVLAAPRLSAEEAHRQWIIVVGVELDDGAPPVVVVDNADLDRVTALPADTLWEFVVPEWARILANDRAGPVEDAIALQLHRQVQPGAEPAVGLGIEIAALERDTVLSLLPDALTPAQQLVGALDVPALRVTAEVLTAV